MYRYATGVRAVPGAAAAAAAAELLAGAPPQGGHVAVPQPLQPKPGRLLIDGSFGGKRKRRLTPKGLHTAFMCVSTAPESSSEMTGEPV